MPRVSSLPDYADFTALRRRQNDEIPVQQESRFEADVMRELALGTAVLELWEWLPGWWLVL